MITITFEPTSPEQAELLGKLLPQYMQAGAQPTRAAEVVDTEQQQADLAAAQVNREDDAAREAMQAKRDAAKKPRAAKAAPAPSQPAEETPAAAQPAAAESPSEPAVTLEQVRAKLAALSQAGKAATVKDLIAGFGVAKLTEVPKDKYAELLAQAEEIA